MIQLFVALIEGYEREKEKKRETIKSNGRLVERKPLNATTNTLLSYIVSHKFNF